MSDKGASGQELRYERDTTEFSRVVAFTDGVVAIAMTLLVLNIELQPPTSENTTGVDVYALVGDASELIFAFVLSFVIIGFYWINHHRFISRLQAIDRAMMVWTLSFLLAIAFMPFATQLIGFYGDNQGAVTLYASWFVVFGIIDVSGYLLARRRVLLDHVPTDDETRFAIKARVIAPVIFGLSIVIAYAVSPRAAMWSWLLIWPANVLLTRNPPPEAEPQLT